MTVQFVWNINDGVASTIAHDHSSIIMLYLIDEISRYITLLHVIALRYIFAFSKKLEYAQRLMDVVKKNAISIRAINAI